VVLYIGPRSDRRSISRFFETEEATNHIYYMYLPDESHSSQPIIYIRTQGSSKLIDPTERHELPVDDHCSTHRKLSSWPAWNPRSRGASAPFEISYLRLLQWNMVRAIPLESPPKGRCSRGGSPMMWGSLAGGMTRYPPDNRVRCPCMERCLKPTAVEGVPRDRVTRP
jgi:hypothetical protein